jgi:undecaprenyl-diphosphatase
MDLLYSLDVSLFLFFNTALQNRIFDSYFRAVTDQRFWYIPLIAMAIGYLWRTRARGLPVIGLALLTVAITDPLAYRILKPFFGRLRPCHPDVLIEGGRFLLGHKGSFSMPSAHAMNWFGQAALWTMWYPSQWGWFLFVAISASFSRIYLGVHYPSDILVGAALGAGIGAAVYVGYRRAVRAIRPAHAPSGAEGADPPASGS